MSGEPHTNGPLDGSKYIDQIDTDDPEYIRQMRRPAEVKEDVKQMEARMRVSNILNSKAFRDELEQLVTESVEKGASPASLLALQQMTEMLTLQRFNQTTGSVFTKEGSTIIPVSDIRGVDSLNYGKGEKLLRCKLACTYRLADMFNWSSGLHGHITARINQEHEHFLINPYGLLYHEVTASSLVKVDMRGEVLDTGSTTMSVNKTTWSIHSAVHAARPDVRSTILVCTTAAQAFSSLDCGLLPMTKEAVLIGEASQIDYTGSLADQDERDKVTRALGPNNKLLILSNHGLLVCGESLDELFLNTMHVMNAVEAQLRAIPIGLDRLTLIPEEVRPRVIDEWLEGAGYAESKNGSKRRWRKGEREFEALMRHMDNMGYRTGYIYHDAVTRVDQVKNRINADVEVPPTASSFASQYDDKFQSPIKQMMEMQKKGQRTDWLNTPNSYIKEEIEETGTPNPKKVTKWTRDEGAPQSGVSMRVENPNQFAPQGDDPRELRKRHQKVRAGYFNDTLSSGPQSKVLEGMSWEEAERLKQVQDTGTTDTNIVVGAASKGIIQRGFQHNAVVYKTHYAPNPFDKMTTEEIEKYKQDVDNRSKEALSGADTDGELGPEGRLISSDERMKNVRDGQRTTPTHRPKPSRPVLETSIDDVIDAPAAAGGDYARERAMNRGETVDDMYARAGPHGGPRDASTPAHAHTLPRTNGRHEPATSPVHDDSASSHFARTASARYAQSRDQDLVEDLQQNFGRSKSERKPHKLGRGAVNGDKMASPTKSTSSGEVLQDTTTDRSSREGTKFSLRKFRRKISYPNASGDYKGSPVKDVVSGSESSTTAAKPKKKKFRMPSFSKKKK